MSIKPLLPFDILVHGTYHRVCKCVTFIDLTLTLTDAKQGALSVSWSISSSGEVGG